MKTKIKVPPNFGSWYRNHRLDKYNLSQNDVIRISKLGRRTVIDVEAGITKSHDEDTIKGLATAIGMTIVELSKKIEKLREEYRSLIVRIEDFNSLLKTFTEIDDYTRHLIRSIYGKTRRSNPEMVKNSYQDLLYAQISQRFSRLKNPLQDFSTFLNEPGVISKLANSLPREDLTVRVSEGFNSIEFSTDDKKLNIKKPELLWDCICKSPTEIDDKNCRIHSRKNGEIITENFSKNVKIKYRDFEFYWRNLDSLWPPSIDSFFFVENIIKNTDIINNPSHRIRSVLDIGSGTGFLGIILSCLIKGVKKLYLSDWTTTSYLYSTLNWHHNIKEHSDKKNISYNFLIAANTYWDYLNDIIQRKSIFDLVVCNPPYLPIPGEFRELRTEQTTAGTELLEHVIQRSKDLGKSTIIQFSHLAEESAQKAARKSKILLKPIGKPKLVPFRVPSALKNQKYMDWLLDENAEGKKDKWALIRNNQEGSKEMRHKFYHYIQSYIIKS